VSALTQLDPTQLILDGFLLLLLLRIAPLSQLAFPANHLRYLTPELRACVWGTHLSSSCFFSRSFSISTRSVSACSASSFAFSFLLSFLPLP
jgi:hypothetical protein